MSRRLIVCGAVKGSPGVTTWALALAAAWPVDRDGGVRPVVVEADADGGDIALRFALPYEPGLLDVAAASGRERPGSVLGAVQELPLGVRAVVAPAAAESCAEAVRLIAAEGGRVLRGQEDELGTVIVDAGRLGEAGMDLLAAADEAVLVCRGGVNDLVHAAARCEAVGESAADFHLVVVGPCGYPAGDIADAMKAARIHTVPWDARSAAVLGGRGSARERAARAAGVRRGWRRRAPLLAAAADWAERMHDRADSEAADTSRALPVSEQPTLTELASSINPGQPTRGSGTVRQGGGRW